MVLLAYVDESYNASYFYLGALIVDASAAKAIDSGLSQLVGEYTDLDRPRPVDRDAELHGYHLFHGVAQWSDLAARERVALYSRAFRVIRASGASYVVRGIDIEQQHAVYEDPYPPHEVVLGHLLEEIERFAKRRSRYALVLADDIHSRDRHRTQFRDFRLHGTPGSRKSKLPNLIDTIHFGPSHHSRLLQAVDLITYLYRRRLTQVEPSERAKKTTENVWEIIDPIVVSRRTWIPKHKGPDRGDGA